MGMRNLDFTGNDNSSVKGVQLFIAFDEQGVVGKQTDKLFLRNEFPLPENLKPGDTLDVAFTNRGKPESIKIVPATNASGGSKHINISAQ